MGDHLDDASAACRFAFGLGPRGANWSRGVNLRLVAGLRRRGRAAASWACAVCCGSGSDEKVFGAPGIRTCGGDTIKKSMCLGPLGIETGGGDMNKWYRE